MKGPLHVFQEASIIVGFITPLTRAFSVSYLLYLHHVSHILSTALFVLTIPSNAYHFIFAPFMK